MYSQDILYAWLRFQYRRCRRHSRRLVQQEHHRERKGLLEAFALLNPSKTGYVDVRTWMRLAEARKYLAYEDWEAQKEEEAAAAEQQ